MLHRLHDPRALAVVFFLAALAACTDDVESPFAPELAKLHSPASAEAFGVYTQNVYLGGDTGPLFTLDFSNIPAVLAATNQFWAQVQSSGIDERAAAFVDEIDVRRPHVVSLQEVLRFVVLDGSFRPTGGLDLLASIQAEIAARGLPYETAMIQEGTSSTLPLTFDPAIGGISAWLAFTDRVVILRRTDVDVIGSDQGLYAARLPLGPVTLVRGWARLTVEHGGVPHHLVATHLETQGIRPVHDAQAAELEHAVLAGLDGVTIVAGDLNSDAAAGPGAPSWTPTYGNLVAAGFTDVWAAAPTGGRASGVTCCHDPALQGDEPLAQRIDFVLVRTDTSPHDGADLQRGFFRADIFGDDAADRTASGRWPSDHAGIVATMRIPGPWR